MKRKLSEILDAARSSVGLRTNKMMSREGSKKIVSDIAAAVTAMIDDTTEEEIEAMILPTMAILGGLSDIMAIGEKQFERRKGVVPK